MGSIKRLGFNIARPSIKRPSWPFCMNRDSWQAVKLIGWWAFAPGNAGFIRDLSDGIKRDLTKALTPIYFNDPVFGCVGYADSTGERWANSSVSMSIIFPSTFCAWHCPESTSVANMICVDDVSGDYRNMLQNGTTSYRWRTKAAQARYVDSITGPVVGKWAHVVGLDIGASLRQIYINGRYEAENAQNAGTPDDPIDRIEINAFQAGFSYPAKYADVRIYSYQLSATEIWQLYDPATRWDLYYPLARRSFFVIGTSAGGQQALAGTIAAQSSVAGALNVTRKIAGTIAAQSSVAGALNVTRKIAGTVAAQSSVTGTLTTQQQIALAGTIATQSSVTGALGVNRTIAGTVATQSSVTGALSVTRKIAGTIAAQSSVTGTLTIQGQIALAGLVASQSAVTGSLKVARKIAGTVAAQSSVTGTLSIGIKQIAGVIAATSEVTGALSVLRSMAGTVAAQSSCTGTLGMSWALAGVIAAQSSCTVNLSVQGLIVTPSDIVFTVPSGGNLCTCPSGGNLCTCPSGGNLWTLPKGG